MFVLWVLSLQRNPNPMLTQGQRNQKTGHHKKALRKDKVCKTIQACGLGYRIPAPSLYQSQGRSLSSQVSIPIPLHIQSPIFKAPRRRPLPSSSVMRMSHVKGTVNPSLPTDKWIKQLTTGVSELPSPQFTSLLLQGPGMPVVLVFIRVFY